MNEKRIKEAETRVKELWETNLIKRLKEPENFQLKKFYEMKAKQRLRTAKVIFKLSQSETEKEKNKLPNDYNDFSEVFATSYYAMYYMTHAYLAQEPKIKLKENTRGIHTITLFLILYYLVKTNKLAKHLYEAYVKSLETTAEIQKLSLEYFKKQAIEFAEDYETSKTAREDFTYKTTARAEAFHAEQAVKTAEEFINTIQQLLQK
ncbi:MAG: hypothetical protein Q8R18_00610 [bacterium]|nr:hypothetical protein [bacterium]